MKEFVSVKERFKKTEEIIAGVTERANEMSHKIISGESG